MWVFHCLDDPVPSAQRTCCRIPRPGQMSCCARVVEPDRMLQVNESGPPAATVIPVSLLVGSARRLIERHLGLSWISGEVSNCSRAASGHSYFVLKDDDAQVRCVMYRSRAQFIDFQLRDGQRVEVRALPTIYEPRG